MVDTLTVQEARDIRGADIVVFTAMVDRIRLTCSLVQMLVIRTGFWLALTSLTGFVCLAGTIVQTV